MSGHQGAWALLLQMPRRQLPMMLQLLVAVLPLLQFSGHEQQLQHADLQVLLWQMVWVQQQWE